MCYRMVLQVPYLHDEKGNFEPELEKREDGPGEAGRAHKLRSDQENEASQSLSDYGMNMACSDEISLDRSIPDTRASE